MKKITFLTFLLLSLSSVSGQVLDLDFDMTKPLPRYSDSIGYGYDRDTWAVTKSNNQPAFFSVKVPEGDYKVTVTIGSRQYAGVTAIKTETRRLVTERVVTKKGEFQDVVFNVNIRTPYVDSQTNVVLQNREKIDWGWDNKLTLEFNGDAPAVSRVRIEPNKPKIKIWLCGNSTVTDQDGEPYTSWGQILPYWFDENVSIENMAMSGLTTSTFIEQNRLEKIIREINAGDYVVIEFGHNDENDRKPGSGAWYNFSYNLKRFIDLLRPKGANIILATPIERRTFKDGTVSATHGDYPDAIRTVAKREHLLLIDLTTSTTELYNAMGDSLSKKLFVHYPPKVYPGLEWGIKDDTHSNAFGAYEICKLVIMGFKANNLEPVKYLRPQWRDFNPRNYDSWQDFYWPRTPTHRPEKPAGR